jgi:hypothetical protein
MTIFVIHSRNHGAVLCFHDKYGNGKSATTSIVARGRHPQGPKRFLIVSPDSCTTGTDWLNNIKVKLGIVESTSYGDLVTLLNSVMLTDGPPTDDKFRLDVNGERRHAARQVQGKPLLILEDLNPFFC